MHFFVWFCFVFLSLPKNKGTVREIPTREQGPRFREGHWKEGLKQKSTFGSISGVENELEELKAHGSLNIRKLMQAFKCFENFTPFKKYF